MSSKPSKRLRVGVLGGLLAALIASPVRARPAVVETMPISEVRPGMRGHAVTVFEGEQTDKFEIEVVDVVSNYLPRQDAILFRSTDPRLAHSGIVGGMSGSPIFIEGKLVGALAYGWRFNKDALGGITPIANMLAVGALPYRPDALPHPRAHARAGTAGWADAMLGLRASPLPVRRRARELVPDAGLAPLSLPLSVSGLGATAADLLGAALGMAPTRGGGRTTPKARAAPPKTWNFGDSVSVVLVDGDSSVAANGTVTWVGPKGTRLLAFGHSMFDAGPTNVPIADARVHTIINSYERSVKLASPLKIRGLMYQDRQAAIALRIDKRAPMIPVHTEMSGPERTLARRTYDNRIAVGVDLTPNLAAVILAEAVDEAGRDATELVVAVHHSIDIETSEGARTLEIDEEVFFEGGLEGRVMGNSRGIAVLSVLFKNPFEVAQIRAIRNRIEMQYGAPIDTIEEVRLNRGDVRAGSVIRLGLVLRDHKGESRLEHLPLRIPEDARDQQIKIEVGGGTFVRPYRPIPNNLDDLLTTLEQSYPSRAIVATIYRQSEGLSTPQGLLRGLPDSVLETLSRRGSTRNPVRFKQMSRRVIPTKKLIEGTHSVTVKVLPRSAF